jgi:integrase
MDFTFSVVILRQHRSGGIMSLYRRSSSGPWWYRFEVAGVERRGSTGTRNRREAEEAERRTRAELESSIVRGARGQVDLAQLAEWDLQRGAAKGTTPDWATELERTWAVLCSVFGARADASRITFEDLEGYVATRRGAGIRGQTIRRELQALRRGLELGKKRGKLVRVPAAWPEIASDAPCVGRSGKLVPVEVLSKWIDKLPADAADEAWVVLLTGLRDGEVKRLTWRWVEPAPAGLPVSWVLRAPAGATKRRRERVIGLPDIAYATLRRRADLFGEDAPLFGTSHRTAYENAATAVGWSRAITLRDLRHTHATMSAQLTGDAEATRAALGHADLATTQRYLTATLARSTSSAAVVSDAMSRHRGVGTPETPAPESDASKGTPGRDRTGDLQFRKPGGSLSPPSMHPGHADRDRSRVRITPGVR